MKRCPKCRTEKPETEFRTCRSRQDGLQSTCRGCQDAYDKLRYQQPDVRAALRSRNQQRRQALREWIVEHLTKNHCVDCKEADPVVLDFDHVRGLKRGPVTALVRAGVALETLVQEVAKCEVRCANCHRRATARRSGQWFKQILPQ